MFLNRDTNVLYLLLFSLKNDKIVELNNRGDDEPAMVKVDKNVNFSD